MKFINNYIKVLYNICEYGYMEGKYKYYCDNCEIEFDVKTRDMSVVFFCPFCGNEINNNEDEQDLELDEDIFEELEI